MSDGLFIALELIGYCFVSCFCIGVVVCTAKSLKICYTKYVLRLPDEEEPIFRRYAKAVIAIVPFEFANAIVVDGPVVDGLVAEDTVASIVLCDP